MERDQARIKYISIGGERFIEGKDFIFVRDNRFIESTSDKEINKKGFNGLYYDIHTNRVGYIITHPDKVVEITCFKPKMEIGNPDDFSNLVEIFKQTCSRHENYSYYNLYCDIIEKDITTEDEGPIKEITIGKDDKSIRMYYYKNEKAVVKAGIRSIVLGYNEYDSIYFDNVDDFTTFAEGIIPYCVVNNLSFDKYINTNYMLQHFELQRFFTLEAKIMDLKVLATSFCCPGNAVLVYYDNKKTLLATVKKYNEEYPGFFVYDSFVPVKLDKDFQTAEEFRDWISYYVDPYCQKHKTNYVGFVNELNKQYDERHKNELLALQLKGVQKELISKKYNKNTRDIEMNAKPNHSMNHQLDDTGIVGKILNQLENDEQLDILAGIPNNRGNERRQ